jgi:hypothetical protein
MQAVRFVSSVNPDAKSQAQETAPRIIAKTENAFRKEKTDEDG